MPLIGFFEAADEVCKHIHDDVVVLALVLALKHLTVQVEDVTDRRRHQDVLRNDRRATFSTLCCGRWRFFGLADLVGRLEGAFFDDIQIEGLVDSKATDVAATIFNNGVKRKAATTCDKDVEHGKADRRSTVVFGEVAQEIGAADLLIRWAAIETELLEQDTVDYLALFALTGRVHDEGSAAICELVEASCDALWAKHGVNCFSQEADAFFEIVAVSLDEILELMNRIFTEKFAEVTASGVSELIVRGLTERTEEFDRNNAQGFEFDQKRLTHVLGIIIEECFKGETSLLTNCLHYADKLL